MLTAFWSGAGRAHCRFVRVCVSSYLYPALPLRFDAIPTAACLHIV